MPRLNRRRAHSRRLGKSLMPTASSGSSFRSEFRASNHSVVSEVGWMDAEDESVITSTIDDIKDLFHMCKEQISTKHLSVLLFLCLRHFNIN